MPKNKPKTLGECIDAAYKMRASRIAYQRKVEEKIAALKAEEEEMEQHILAAFDKSEIEGAKGTLCSASVTRLVVPAVKDWPAVFKFIAEHDAWDLMEKRMARVAYRDRVESGEAIPGTESFVKVGLSLTKINKE